MLLELLDITKFFGGLNVLSDVSFHIDEGEIVGLIGPNGAGKTTLFNVITGIYRPDAGLIRFRGKNMVGLRSDRISFPMLDQFRFFEVAKYALGRPMPAGTVMCTMNKLLSTMEVSIPHGYS
jgi:ABC-type branched-subunit amino acid transport system ATPase component